VRSSKYRHVFGTPAKKEHTYDGIKPSKSAWDSNKVAASSKFIGCIWDASGGGAFCVLDINKKGKLGQFPLVTGHTAEVLDIDFSPFNDNIIASVSEDCYGKIWQIPPDFQGTEDKEVQLLKGHQRKVGNVSWNPVAENVLATGGTDYAVKIWDVSTGDEKLHLTGHTAIIQSLAWNYDGSLLSSFCKDKKLRVFDPRTNSIAGEANAHQGVKGGRALWIGKHDKVFSVGFGATSERQYFIFDSKNLSAPLVGPVNIDNSAGQIMPFYDEDSELLFLAGKGDGNIRYYEIEAEGTNSGKPEVFFVSQYSSNEPTAAIGSMPKRGCDVTTNEIVKLFRVVGTKLEPLSFKVPRKSDLFQEDIFPDCRSDEFALTAEQWFAGENSKPKTKSLQGGFAKREATATSFTKKEEGGSVGGSVADHGELAELRKENSELKNRVALLEAEIARLKST